MCLHFPACFVFPVFACVLQRVCVEVSLSFFYRGCFFRLHAVSHRENLANLAELHADTVRK